MKIHRFVAWEEDGVWDEGLEEEWAVVREEAWDKVWDREEDGGIGKSEQFCHHVYVVIPV